MSQFNIRCLDCTEAGLMTDPIYKLLREDFVRSESFKLVYSVEYLRWILKRSLVVTLETAGGLVGVILGIPCEVLIESTSHKAVFIDFLCVRRDYRSRRLTPLLIQSLEKFCASKGFTKAIFNTQLKKFKFVTSARYYHYPLNLEKLFRTGFFVFESRVTTIMKRLYKRVFGRSLEKEASEAYVVEEFQEHHIPSVLQIISREFAKYKVSKVYNEQEVRYWLLKTEEKPFLHSYVIISKGTVLDFFCFYQIDSESLKTKEVIKACYLFFATSVNLSLTEVAGHIITKAGENGFDILNCTDIMGNKAFIEKFRFIEGTGFMRCCLYNISCRRIEARDFGFTLP